ncbi:MAG: DUF563 domain-containing protein [Gammaproteobacteria bacterium]|nr:DUF563 domain-containing protein [Gammaproteobacteria bacterium]
MNAEAVSLNTSETHAPTNSATVNVGAEGWLFATGINHSLVRFYQTDSSFSDELAHSWAKLIGERTERMNERGIEYCHLGVPDKLSIFSEHYSGDLPNLRGNPITRIMDQYAAKVPQFVNLVEYFRQGAQNGTALYWKTDALWSCWGAYAAYQMLMHRLGDPLKADLLSYPYTESELISTLGATVDPQLSETIRFYNFERYSARRYANELVCLRENHKFESDADWVEGSHVIYENRAASAIDKVVVIFGDSYAGEHQKLLTGMLAESYREVHFIWSAHIDDDYVKSVEPDVVLTVLHESRMTEVPNDSLNIKLFARDRVKQMKKIHPELKKKPQLNIAVNPNYQKGVFTPEKYQLDPPVTVQPGCVNNGNDKSMDTTHVTMSLMDSPKVYLTGDRCLVTDSDGQVAVRSNIDEERAERIEFERYRKLKGTSLLLGNSAGANCYYHWRLDLLPKIGLMERMGISVDSVDYFLVREITHQFQVDTLNRFGITGSRVIETKKRSFWQPEKLIHFHLINGINMKMNRFIPAWLNHTFPASGKRTGGRKLYISRPQGVRRGVSNEQEFRPMLEAAGFEFVVMEGLSVSEQATLMADVDVLMSPHGGALTNMVFCRPGIQVIELFGRHVYPYYYGLAQLCGHRYYTVLEDPTDYPRLINYEIAESFGSAEIQATTMSLPFDVSPVLLERLLQKLKD